jgi:hypothetical protein
LIHNLCVGACDDDDNDFETNNGGDDKDDGSDRDSVKSTPSRSMKKGQALHIKSPGLRGKSTYVSSEVDTAAPKRKRASSSPTTNAKHGIKKLKTTPGIPKRKTKMAYTIDSIKLIWPEGIEYGDSFRAMGPEEQRAEVDRLNKGLEKGMKSVIKTKLLSDNYKKIVADKLQSHLSHCRASVPSMFHAAPATRTSILQDVNFISVGEWVEVDGDRSVGYNSEGGIAVIIKVEDNLADVK